MKPVRPFNADRILPPSGASPFALPPGFEPGTPVDLEIGCGVGWHPIRYARENPGRFLIAIEHTSEKFEKFASRLSRHEPLPNLLAVHADAIAWVTHCLGPGQLSRVLLLYPNPNPKNPSQRWIRMPFMQRLLESLRPGGELRIATNERFYADEVREFSRDPWKLKPLEDLSFTQETRPAGYPRTHFEKKYLLRGETCFELRFTAGDGLRAGSPR